MWDTAVCLYQCVSAQLQTICNVNFPEQRWKKPHNNSTKVFCTSAQPQPGSAMAVLEHKHQGAKQTLQGTKMGAVLTRITEGKSLLVDIFLLYFLLHIVPRSHCDRSIRNA